MLNPAYTCTFTKLYTCTCIHIAMYMYMYCILHIEYVARFVYHNFSDYTILYTDLFSLSHYMMQVVMDDIRTFYMTLCIFYICIYSWFVHMHVLCSGAMHIIITYFCRCGTSVGLFFCPVKYLNIINQMVESRKESLILKIVIPSIQTSHIRGMIIAQHIHMWQQHV